MYAIKERFSGSVVRHCKTMKEAYDFIQWLGGFYATVKDLGNYRWYMRTEHGFAEAFFEILIDD